MRNSEQSAHTLTLEQVKVLNSPIRMAVVGALKSSGPIAVSQIAQLCNRPRTAIHYHVMEMAEAGLLRVLPPIASNRRSGYRYELIHNRYKFKLTDDPAYIRARNKAADSITRNVARAYRRAVEIDPGDPRILLETVHTRLAPAAIRKLHETIRTAIAELEEEGIPEGAPFIFMVLTTPS